MPVGCQTDAPGSKSDRWNKSVIRLHQMWNSNEDIVRVLGRAGEDTDGNRIFEETFFTVTGMVPSDVPQGKWYDSQFKLVEKEIAKMAKQLKDPRYNTMLGLVGTTSANLEATPQSKLFLEEIRQTSNFESSQTNRMMGYVERIRKNLVSAIMEEAEGDMGYRASWRESRNLKKIEKAEAELAAAVMSSDPGAAKRIEKYRAQVEAMSEQHAGRINRIFVAMMDKYTLDELVNIDADGKPVEIEFSLRPGTTEKATITNRAIVAAAIESKRMLKDMGYNLARALNGFADFTKMVHANGMYKDRSNADIINDPDVDKTFKKRIQMIDDAQESLQQSIKEGKYFPHYLINANAKIMSGMSKVANKYRDMSSWESMDGSDGVREIFESLSDYLPGVAKQRATDSTNAYHINALGVIKQYGADVINFNKLVYSQNALVRAFNNIPKGPDAGEGWAGIREYMLKTFQLHTEGYSNRDPNINNLVRTITAFEFVSKMGFGVTTAARNAASMTFFIHHVGWGNWKRLGKDIQENQNLRAAIDEVSKNHVGFLYGVDVSQISQGGVNATEGIRRPGIRESGEREGEFEVTDAGFANTALNAGIDATVRFTGVFQSMTENWMRREMFERMFAQYYQAFSRHPQYLTVQRLAKGLEPGSQEFKDATAKYSKAEAELRKRAANYALSMVDAWAFNYDPSSKATIAGGTTGNAGAIGQVLMQFMHYPLEFTFRQSKQAAGAFRAIGAAAKSDDAYMDKMRFMMANPDVRGAVLTLLSTVVTGYLTALTGSNIAGLFENAIVEKGKAMHELLTGDEEERKQANYGRGLINLFTGPFLSDVMTIGMAQGVLDLPQSVSAQMLLGFNQFIDQTEDEKLHAQLRTLQPHVYNMINKDIPNVMSGNLGRVLERNLAMAPNRETTQAREDMMGDKGGPLAEFFKEQKKRKKREQAVKSLNIKGPQVVQPRTVLPNAVQARQALQSLREQ